MVGSETSSTGVDVWWRPYLALWPVVVGFMFARCGIIYGSYGSYVSTDAGLSTDGATFVATLILFIVFVILAASKRRLGDRSVKRLAYLCVGLQVLLLAALSVCHALIARGVSVSGPFVYALHVGNSVFGLFNLMFWLRCLRGLSTYAALVTSVLAFSLSELLLIPGILLPDSLDCVFSGILVITQLPLIPIALNRHDDLENLPMPPCKDRISMMKNSSSDISFLIVIGISIGFMSFVIGLLRGYPDGNSIPFTPATRVGYVVVIYACYICMFAMIQRVHTRDVIVHFFIVMQMLACIAMVFYAFFPDTLQYGATFATALNAIMCAFDSFIIAVYMSYGSKDPYYYGIGGYVVFLLARSVGRMSEGLLSGLGIIPPVMMAIMATCLVISMQVLYSSLLRVCGRELEDTQGSELEVGEVPAGSDEAHGDMSYGPKGGPHNTSHMGPEGVSTNNTEAREHSLVTRVMGLDRPDPETTQDARRSTMQHYAEEIGQQFLLSEREIEVLALYALGYTQQSVGKELYIAPSTVHAHIKRIYAKTNMHSRQDILDYIAQYGD